MGIQHLFERRSFTKIEREKMKALYTEAGLLANRIEATVPACAERDMALMKVREALSYCEMAVAVHPHSDGLEYEQEMAAVLAATRAEVSKRGVAG